MRFSSKKLLTVSILAVSQLSAPLAPPLAFAQNTSTVETSLPPHIADADDQKAAEILLWEKRLAELVSYILDNDLTIYSVSEEDYQSNDLDHLIDVGLGLSRSDRVGDQNRILDRINELALKREDQQALKVGQILRLRSEANPASVSDRIETLKTYEADPDWLVSLASKSAIRSLRIIHQQSSVSRTDQTAQWLVPSQSDDRYVLGKNILSDMTALEKVFQMDLGGTYESLLESILAAQSKNEVAPILVQVQNLISILAHKFGRENFRECSEKILEIEFPDALKAQAIIMFEDTYQRTLSPEVRKQYLERVLTLDPSNGYMHNIAKVKLTMLGVEMDDRNLVERHRENTVFESPGYRPRVILMKLYLGELTLSEAAVRQRDHRENLHFKRREPVSFDGRPFTNTDIRFEDGRAELIKPTAPQERQVLLNYRLTKQKIERLEDSIIRLSAINTFAEKTPYHGARVAEYMDGASLSASSVNRSAEDIGLYMGLSLEDADLVQWARINPIYQSTLRKTYPEQTGSFVGDPNPATQIDQAYRDLLNIKIELRSGRVDSSWTRLKSLGRIDGLSSIEKSHLSLDILIAETELLFLEGNTSALISHISDISQQAVRLNRRINPDYLLALLAISVQNYGYVEYAAQAVDALLKPDAAPGAANGSANFIPFYLRAKVLIANNELEQAEAVISKAIENTNRPEDEAVLLAELLNIYSSDGLFEKITETRTRLLNRIDIIGSDALFASVQPVLARSSYVLDQSQGEDASAAYAAYTQAQNNWIESEQTRRSNLSVRRIAAEGEVLTHATNALEAAQALQASRETRYQIFLALIALLSILSAFGLHRSWKTAKRAALSEARTAKMQKLYDRTLKDDYFQTTRLMRRIQQQISRIVPRVEDIRDEQMLELILEDVETHEKTIVKSAFLRRMQAGGARPIPAQISLHLFGQKAKAYWEKQAMGADLKLEFDIQPPLAKVFLDEHYLNIITTEMIQRALEHTVFGLIKVSLSYNPSDESVTLDVQDTGHGNQDPKTDYFLTEKASAALGGDMKFHIRDGFAWGVQVSCPAPRVDIIQMEQIDVPSALRIVSTNDR